MSRYTLFPTTPDCILGEVSSRSPLAPCWSWYVSNGYHCTNMMFPTIDSKSKLSSSPVLTGTWFSNVLILFFQTSISSRVDDKFAELITGNDLQVLVLRFVQEWHGHGLLHGWTTSHCKKHRIHTTIFVIGFIQYFCNIHSVTAILIDSDSHFLSEILTQSSSHLSDVPRFRTMTLWEISENSEITVQPPLEIGNWLNSFSLYFKQISRDSIKVGVDLFINLQETWWVQSLSNYFQVFIISETRRTKGGGRYKLSVLWKTKS